MALFRRKQKPDPLPEINVRVTFSELDFDAPPDFSEGIGLAEDECDWRSPRGELLHGKGMRIVTAADSLGLNWTDANMDALWEEMGVLAVRVAGVTHHLADAQSPAFEPGKTVVLRREPGAGGDESAVSVWSEDAKETPGWVPRHSSAIASNMVTTGPVDALTIWEWRKEDGARCGLRIIVCPKGTLHAARQ